MKRYFKEVIHPVYHLFLNSWVTRISRKMAFAKGNCECMGGKMLKRQPISKNQNPDLGIAKAEWRGFGHTNERELGGKLRQTR